MIPKVITVANTKGGVGKTLISLQLAIFRALNGKEVWFVDGDAQATGCKALDLRDENSTVIPFSNYPDGKTLARQVLHQKAKWDHIVIDVGGYDSASLRAALMVSDLLLIPFQPRAFDTWALEKMSHLIEELELLGKKILVFAILNNAEPQANSADNAEAVRALEDYPNINWINCPLARRKAFAKSAGTGSCVTEMKVKDQKAINELTRLADEIFADRGETGEKI